jgi:Ca2+ transporting ATPase
VKLNESKLQVTREGKVVEIETKDIVVGDLLYFNIGIIVPVDGIMISGSEVRVDESAFTGESDPIKKISVKEII